MSLTTEYLLLIMLVWAFAEAIFSPFMPDALLVPLAVANPHLWWQLVIASLIGSGCGGVMMYIFSKKDLVGDLTKLPLISSRMVAQCHAWLSSEGSKGVRHQALSLLPFKVFAATAAQLDLPLFRFLMWALLVRGLRFLVVAILSATGGTLFPNLVKNHGWLLSLLWAVVFSAGLALSVRKWQTK